MVNTLMYCMYLKLYPYSNLKLINLLYYTSTFVLKYLKTL